MFKAMDKNGDGVLTYEEFEIAMSQNDRIDEHKLKELTS